MIKECVDQSGIKISSLSEKEVMLCRKIVEHASEVHLGEAQAIVLARKTDTLLLMDEPSGRAFAETWGLKVKGTIYVIMRALREELLNRNEAKEATLQLISKGFRIEPKLLARILKEVEGFVPRNG